MGRKFLFFGLVRFVQEKAHAEDFLRGKLHLNSLSVYRTLEEEQQARADPDEGVMALFQGPGTIQFGDFVVPFFREEMAGPMTIIPNEIDRNRVLCMHAVTSRGFEGKTPYDLAYHLQIDDRCRKFGPWAVAISDPRTFVKRVRAVARGLQPHGGLVDYHNRWTFNGRVRREGFHKDLFFAHEREYRLTIRPAEGAPSPYQLNIGDISDIAMVVRSETLFGMPKFAR